LRAGKLPPRFAARDVYRAGWAALTDREVVEEALMMLDDYGWVRRRVERGTGGAPPAEYTPHPPGCAEAAAFRTCEPSSRRSPPRPRPRVRKLGPHPLTEPTEALLSALSVPWGPVCRIHNPGPALSNAPRAKAAGDPTGPSAWSWTTARGCVRAA